MTRRRGDASPSKTAFKAAPKGRWSTVGGRTVRRRTMPALRLVGGKGRRYNPPPHPSGFRPRIVVRGMLLIAGMTNERLLEQSIPDRSPGHAFIAIAHPGWRRHTKL